VRPTRFLCGQIKLDITLNNLDLSADARTCIRFWHGEWSRAGLAWNHDLDFPDDQTRFLRLP